MYSSIMILLAVGSLYLTSSLAVPTTSPLPSIGAIVNHLNSDGMLEWSPAANGGRTTTIPGNLVSQAHQELAANSSRQLEARGGPSTGVGGFTNMGRVAGVAASYACETSGAYGVSSTIYTYATAACTSLVAQVPDAPIAETAWRVYQSAASPGANGAQVTTIFRFFTNTARTVALTQGICSTAFIDLTTNLCQGKDDHGADTRGGEIRIGTGDDYLMIGLDPNYV